MAYREHQFGQLALVEHVEHVGLVLGPISGPGQPEGAVAPLDDTGVVTGGQTFEAQCPGPDQKPVELDVPVALHARVRRPAYCVVGQVGGHHMLVEVVAQVEHVVVDAKGVGHPAGVVHVGHRAAPGV